MWYLIKMKDLITASTWFQSIGKRCCIFGKQIMHTQAQEKTREAGDKVSELDCFLTFKEFGEFGESARLPPMCPGFDSRTRRHKWAEFVGSLLCSERFFSGYSGFPLSSKTNIWFDLIYVDLQSPQLVKHLCSARKIWDLNKVVIILSEGHVSDFLWYQFDSFNFEWKISGSLTSKN